MHCTVLPAICSNGRQQTVGTDIASCCSNKVSKQVSPHLMSYHLAGAQSSQSLFSLLTLIEKNFVPLHMHTLLADTGAFQEYYYGANEESCWENVGEGAARA
jgi:hypothetical protein